MASDTLNIQIQPKPSAKILEELTLIVMSSEVENLSIFRALKASRFLDSARNDKIHEDDHRFRGVNVYHDTRPGSAAMNMAIDEALLEYARFPLFAFIAGNPLLSHLDILVDLPMSPATRASAIWSGVGRRRNCFSRRRPHVFHCDSARRSAFAESSISIYEKIHRALCDALVKQATAL
jgi:hypothetical protein